MTLQDLINFAKKNNLSFDTEIVISDYNDKSIDSIYVSDNKIAIETYD